MDPLSTNSSPLPPLLELVETIQESEANEEIQFENNRYVTRGCKSTNSIFGFFKALFRTEQERQKNRDTILKVREDVIKTFGKNSDALKKFQNAFSSKLASGSPLTKGALLRFKESLSGEDKEILEDSKKHFEEIKTYLQKKKEAITTTEKDYWEQVIRSCKYERIELVRGHQKEAHEQNQITQGYLKAIEYLQPTEEFPEGRKNLAHYVEQATTFYNAERIALRDKSHGYEDEVDRYKNIQDCYNEAIRQENANKSGIAEYWDKAAKCLTASYCNKSVSKAFIEKFTIYQKAANNLASQEDIQEADEFIKKYWTKGQDIHGTFNHYFMPKQ